MSSHPSPSNPQPEPTNENSRLSRATLSLAVSLLAIGAYFATRGQVGDYRVENHRLQDTLGQTIAYRTYVPQPHTRPVPGVLLAHGVNNNKETMDLVARELVRRGLVVMSFDFGGHGESYRRGTDGHRDVEDLRRVLEALSQHQAVDGQKLAIVGHSIGARAAVQTACGDDRVRVVVAMSMSIDASRQQPRNVLWTAGIYDQCHPWHYLLEDLQRGAGQTDANPGIVYGTMANGTARQLCLSPQTDHLLAPYDPRVIDATVTWVTDSVCERPGKQPGVRAHRLAAARSCAIAGAALLVFFTVTTVLCRWRQRWENSHFRRAIALLGGGAVLAPIAGSWFLGGSPVLWSDVSMAMLFGFLATNLLLRATVTSKIVSHRPAVGMVWALQLGAILYLAWLVSVIIGRAGYLSENPDAAWSIPAFAFQVLAALPHHLLLKLRMVLFAEYSLNLVPSLVLMGVLFVEAIIPGEIAYTVSKAIGAALNAMRIAKRPSKASDASRSQRTKTARVRQALLLTILVALIIILCHRLVGMDPDVRAAMGHLALRLIVVPVLVVFLLVNVPWLRCFGGGQGGCASGTSVN